MRARPLVEIIPTHEISFRRDVPWGHPGIWDTDFLEHCTLGLKIRGTHAFGAQTLEHTAQPWGHRGCRTSQWVIDTFLDEESSPSRIYYPPSLITQRYEWGRVIDAAWTKILRQEKCRWPIKKKFVGVTVLLFPVPSTLFRSFISTFKLAKNVYVCFDTKL